MPVSASHTQSSKAVAQACGVADNFASPRRTALSCRENLAEFGGIDAPFFKPMD
jgi:hypothetical protein